MIDVKLNRYCWFMIAILFISITFEKKMGEECSGKGQEDKGEGGGWNYPLFSWRVSVYTQSRRKHIKNVFLHVWHKALIIWLWVFLSGFRWYGNAVFSSRCKWLCIIGWNIVSIFNNRFCRNFVKLIYWICDYSSAHKIHAVLLDCSFFENHAKSKVSVEFKSDRKAL